MKRIAAAGAAEEAAAVECKSKDVVSWEDERTVAIFPEPEVVPPEKAPPPKADTPPCVCITFTRVGAGEGEALAAELEEQLILGRNSRKSQLSFTQDLALSGAHCVLRYEEGGLVLEDMGSTNGTYLNGIPVEAPIKVQQGDILLAGSQQLRINWTAKETL